MNHVFNISVLQFSFPEFGRKHVLGRNMFLSIIYDEEMTNLGEECSPNAETSGIWKLGTFNEHLLEAC